MKGILSVIAILLFSLLSTKAQTPFMYESVVVKLPSTILVSDFDGKSAPQANAVGFQAEIDKENGQGYKLIQMNTIPLNSGSYETVLVFERSNSFREAELYKLINELTSRIDTTAKKYTDSAMVVIQTNVLSYLKSIPDDVITNAYKANLTKMILAEAEEKIKKVVDELKKEIRNQTNN